MDQRHISQTINQRADQYLTKQEEVDVKLALNNEEQREWRVSKLTLPVRNSTQAAATNKDLNRETQMTFTSMQNNVLASQKDESIQNSQFTIANMISECNLDQLFSISQSIRSAPQDKSPGFGDMNSGLSPTYLKSVPYQIYAAKTFKYWCLSCQKTFSSNLNQLYNSLGVLLVDFNMQQENDLSLTMIQELFNSGENHVCQCPYCQKIVMTILSASLIVGSQEQMEQYDLINNADNLHLMEKEYDCHGQTKREIKNIPNTLEGAASEQIVKSNPDQFQLKDANESQLKQSLSNDKEGSSDKLIAPPIFRHKFQKLRNSKKYAQMIILGETQPVSQHLRNQPTLLTMAETVVEDRQSKTGTTFVALEIHNNQSESLSKSHLEPPKIGQSVKLDSQASQSHQYFPPEAHHKPSQKQCEQFNKDLMREMINQKMRKSKTFMELKVLPTLEKPKTMTKHQQFLFEQGLLKPAKI